MIPTDDPLETVYDDIYDAYFDYTGEYRLPKAGEYYWSNKDGFVVKAISTHSMPDAKPRLIYKKREAPKDCPRIAQRTDPNDISRDMRLNLVLTRKPGGYQCCELMTPPQSRDIVTRYHIAGVQPRSFWRDYRHLLQSHGIVCKMKGKHR